MQFFNPQKISEIPQDRTAQKQLSPKNILLVFLQEAF